MDYEAAFCSDKCLEAFESELLKRGDNDAGQA